MFKRLCILLALMVLAFGAEACLYSNVKGIGPVTSRTNYTLTTEDFQILGQVEASGTIKMVLGLVAWGGSGYSVLMDKAKKMGGDDLMNYKYDVEQFSIITFIYNKGTWRARATVIKYRDKAKK